MNCDKIKKSHDEELIIDEKCVEQRSEQSSDNDFETVADDFKPKNKWLFYISHFITIKKKKYVYCSSYPESFNYLLDLNINRLFLGEHSFFSKKTSDRPSVGQSV